MTRECVTGAVRIPDGVIRVQQLGLTRIELAAVKLEILLATPDVEAGAILLAPCSPAQYDAVIPPVAVKVCQVDGGVEGCDKKQQQAGKKREGEQLL
ncbi:MAG: hypothetical protein M3220_10285 [Chloroflexota bacterium]|nr:hypothetical protein [Chloroflexota bacterium]